MDRRTAPRPLGVRVRVPAKVNLGLLVGPRRSDGFHPLATVYHAVSLFDEVVADSAPPGTFAVGVTGESADRVPTGNDNLAVIAATLLAEAAGRDDVGVVLTIEKQIPMAGGLAGGSADAAAALVACAGLWGLEVTTEQLMRLAGQLGSDVPFALVGGTAVGTGRGEVVAPALAGGTHHWVLAFGQQSLSTPVVYRRYDELRPKPPRPKVPAELMAALRSGDSVRLGKALINDLQPAALDLQPRLKLTLEAGLDHGAAGAVVSGSGPTVAFLAADEAGAVDLSVALSADGVARQVRRASGPVPGARVVTG